MSRWAGLSVVVGFALTVLTGCATPVSAPVEPEAPVPSVASAPPVSSPEPASPDLLNLWRVTGAAGESAQTWLRIDDGRFQLWRGSGMVDGQWTGTASQLLASPTGYIGQFDGATPDLTVDWFTGVLEYRRTDAGWELLDGAGDVVATLSIDGAPTPIPSASDSYAHAPVVTEEGRAALEEGPEPLPASVVPAMAEDLLGRWVPAGATYASDPFVVLEDDGTWSGSDGCNGGRGRWAVLDGGRLLTTSGSETLIGCEGAPVPAWVAWAEHAGFDGEVLVLFGRDGTDAGRLQRG